MIMMKRIIITGLALLLLLATTFSEEHEKKPAKLNGKYTWEQWQKGAGWDDYFAPAYALDEDKLKEFTNLSDKKDIHFIVFAGDWCGDSKDEVPKVFKIFNFGNIFFDKISLYGVDRDKKDTTGTAQKYNIEKVPTLLILQGNNEIGRIVEHPQKDWLEDILTILMKN